MLRRADVTYFANALLKCANVLLKCADVLLKRAKWYRHAWRADVTYFANALLKCADVLLKRAKWYRLASTCRRDVLCKCAA